MNIGKKEAPVSTERCAAGQKWGILYGSSYVRSVLELLTVLLWIPVPVKGGCSSHSVRPCSCFLEKIFPLINKKTGQVIEKHILVK